jgi:hypothetical protein
MIQNMAKTKTQFVSFLSDMAEWGGGRVPMDKGVEQLIIIFLLSASYSKFIRKTLLWNKIFIYISGFSKYQ